MSNEDDATDTVYHHYFLFRHCVRSTSAEIKVGIPGENSTLSAADLLVAGDLPNWQVPDDWCTPNAMELAKETGRWLIESGKMAAITTSTANSENDEESKLPKQRIQVELISDKSHRDVDTVFSLAQGMAAAAADLGIQIQRLDQINYVGGIFKLFNATQSDPFFQEEPICTKGFSDQDMHQAIQRRLDQIPPPSSIQDAIDTLKRALGKDVVLNMTVLEGLFTNFTTVAPDNKPRGIAVLLKDFAQMLFYSRAGGIEPDFGSSDASPTDIYNLINWNYWLRAVYFTANPWAAARGAVHSAVLLKVLRQGFFISNNDGDKKEDSKQDAITKATIVTGHDGDLDALATAFGVAGWSLRKPYSDKSADYFSTPPLTAFHVRHAVNKNRIDISLLYPVYSQQANDTWVTNTSGIMEETSYNWPIDGFSELHHEQTETTNSICVKDEKNHDSKEGTIVTLLEKHIASSLKSYVGANECMEASLRHIHGMNLAIHDHPSGETMSTVASDVVVETVEEWQSSPAVVLGLLILGAIFGACGAILVSFIHRRTRRNSSPLDEQYRDVASSDLRIEDQELL